ncbi:hypothetical protein ACFW2E_42595, partial [Streptomyces sp. NPDC058964]
LRTIVPGLYPGRTRHIHVKAQAPGQPVLTTQLYFPGEPRNSTDAIFDPALLMNVRDAGGGKEATFDFVLNVDGGPGPDPTDPPTDPPGGTWAGGAGAPRRGPGGGGGPAAGGPRGPARGPLRLRWGNAPGQPETRRWRPHQGSP